MLKSLFAHWLLTPCIVHKFISNTVAVSLLDLEPSYKASTDSSNTQASKSSFSVSSCYNGSREPGPSLHSSASAGSSTSASLYSSWMESPMAKLSDTSRTKTFSITSDHTFHSNLSLGYGRHLLHVVKFLDSMTMAYPSLLYVVKYFKFLSTAYASLLHIVIDIYNSQVPTNVRISMSTWISCPS